MKGQAQYKKGMHINKAFYSKLVAVVEEEYKKKDADMKTPRDYKEFGEVFIAIGKHEGNIGLVAKTTGYTPTLIRNYRSLGDLLGLEYSVNTTQNIKTFGRGKRYAPTEEDIAKVTTCYKERLKKHGKASVNAVSKELNMPYAPVMKILVDAQLYNSKNKKKDKT